MFWTIASVIMFLALWPMSAIGGDIYMGHASVIDGDTLVIDNRTIRLHGIDAPEIKQKCLHQGEPWSCGQKASMALRERIGDRPVSCFGLEQGRSNQFLAVCHVEKQNLNAWMVLEGWALVYPKFSKSYVAHEGMARTARRGIWRGEFTEPWKWRLGKRRKKLD